MGLLAVAMALYAGAAVTALALPLRSRVATSGVLAMVASSFALAAALPALVRGSSYAFSTSKVLAFGGLDLRLDPLAAVFIVVVAVLGLTAHLYNIGYARRASATRLASALLPLFVASLLAVVVANNVVTFLYSWESMALSSLLLILVEHRHRESSGAAALWYAVMTQAGAGAITLGLLVATSADPTASFTTLSSHTAALTPVLRVLAFILLFAGLASKAGAVPAHVWLPRAHPEASSPASSLMSGAMVAMGIYGLVRLCVESFAPTHWGGLTLILVGAVSALFGSLHASSNPNLKNLLAYSTIDVMGLVMIGLGATELLRASRADAAAHVVLVAAIFMVVAHAGFKAALFLAAGIVERDAGTGNLDRLGGLVRVLPTTTTLFSVAALSIMAVPTLSGFVGEWLLVQGLFDGMGHADRVSIVGLLAGLAAVALSGGFTAVAFTKALGVGFLGRNRGGLTANPPRFDLRHAAVAILALSAPLLGLFPGPLLDAISRAVARPGNALASSAVSTRFFSVHVSSTTLAPVGLALVVLAALVAGRALTRARARRSAAWACGLETLTPRMQYTATSFAEPLQRVFVDVLRPGAELSTDHDARAHFEVDAWQYQRHVDDAIERHAYRPAQRALARAGRLVARFHNGDVHRYLALGFVALIVILVVAS